MLDFEIFCQRTISSSYSRLYFCDSYTTNPYNTCSRLQDISKRFHKTEGSYCNCGQFSNLEACHLPLTASLLAPHFSITGFVLHLSTYLDVVLNRVLNNVVPLSAQCWQVISFQITKLAIIATTALGFEGVPGYVLESTASPIGICGIQAKALDIVTKLNPLAAGLKIQRLPKTHS